MLSKCANPACEAKLHSLHQGKIYRVDTESLARASRRARPSIVNRRDTDASRQVSSLQLIADRGGAYRPEYFWLCADCSQEWTIAVQSGSVVVTPHAKALVLQAAAS